MSDLQAAIIPVTPFQQNCTLLWDNVSKSGVVIDPGGDVAQIAEAIEQTEMKVDFILLTHGHIDHAGGAAELKEKLGVEIIGPHEDDKFLLDGLAEQGREYGFAARDVEPDRWLKEGDDIKLAGLAFEIRHCPGHTPGHLIFINEEIKLAIMGDVLFKGSIGRTDFPGYGDHDALINSIKTKVLTLPDDIMFVCGHGPASSIGDERRSNPFVGEAAV